MNECFDYYKGIILNLNPEGWRGIQFRTIGVNPSDTSQNNNRLHMINDYYCFCHGLMDCGTLLGKEICNLTLT